MTYSFPTFILFRQLFFFSFRRGRGVRPPFLANVIWSRGRRSTTLSNGYLRTNVESSRSAAVETSSYGILFVADISMYSVNVTCFLFCLEMWAVVIFASMLPLPAFSGERMLRAWLRRRNCSLCSACETTSLGRPVENGAKRHRHGCLTHLR